MFRRRRISVVPNFSIARRPASTPQEAPNQEASEASRESNDATALTEKAAVSADGTRSLAGRRIIFKPKVPPSRSSTVSRRQISKGSGSGYLKPATSSQTGTIATPKRLESPRRPDRPPLSDKEFRDVIHYHPMSNPMTSPEQAQEPEVPPNTLSNREEEQEEVLLVPRVKVAEDGTVVIDEESLTVEVQRVKGPNPIESQDPIFEYGSTEFDSSFRKLAHAKDWSSQASQTEFSDEQGHQWQDEEVEEVEHAGSRSKDSSAPVFVPAGLHTPRPQIKEVDETIAEDVIEFISSEHAEEVSDDQSYNEAAQILLTIGNLTHVSQLAQNQIIIPDHVTGEASAGGNETSHLDKELTSKPAEQEKSATSSVSTFGQDITQSSENVATAKQQDSTTDSGEMSIVKTSDEPNPESSNRNTPQSKRGRFFKVKPKPNLGRISRTAQPKSQSEISAGSADPDSSLGCLAPVNEQQSEHDCPSNNSQVPLVCVTQVSSTQNVSSTKDIQSYPIFQDMLPEQVPSDPNEPFFILSLTEIPLSSSGELVHSATEHPSCFSVTESSIPHPGSVSGESVAAAGEESLSNVSMPIFTLKKGEMGLINVKDTEPDPSALIGHTMEKTLDPHESTTDHPPKFPNTVDSNEAEIPLTKLRHTETGRRAKLQVKSSYVRRKQTSKTLSAEAAESAPTHTNTTQDSTHSVPSVEPKPYDAITDSQIRNYRLDKEILTDGKSTNSSLGAQSSQSRGSTCQRKPRDSLSSLPVTNKIAPSPNLPPGKPASKSSKVKTPLAEGKQFLLEPVASTSHDVASTQILTQPPKETHLTSITPLTQTAVGSDRAPITLQCTDEQSDSMDSSFLEEDPTAVSHYFLSDIFTEVEEG